MQGEADIFLKNTEHFSGVLENRKENANISLTKSRGEFSLQSLGDSLGEWSLSHIFLFNSRFCRKYRNLTSDLISSNHQLKMGRTQSDIAIDTIILILT